MSNAIITVRDASAEDASILAKLLLEAGEGLYEFLFSDLQPGQPARDVLARLIAANPGGPLGFRSFRVATLHNADLRCDVVVGMVNAFAADSAPRIVPDWIPADRLAHVARLFQHVVDRDTLLVNALAVKPSQRRMGIGVRLIAETVGMAGAAGKRRMIARVWENNDRALKLYGNFGFKRIDSVELPSHNRLSGRRTLILERVLEG
ncbi:GNAT family N-acetyltransferase [Phaeovibrio sulfidiphilus]|uniref:GNAT family N-acetyltransferase n=1 Tax=Phaeovibrio sulfidiphilus TaxID=1220600 RepID=A0A8J7CP00_9PROT|nr:GNAT family N-acetyltransferase [Phaeovibrio sulfidiphilus]MBE1236467.1 GNAT family N-acetyltransferase [Phaeovibrio sulfidiphilus]